MRFAGLPTLLMTALLLAISSLWAFPARARGAVVGAPLSTCVASARAGDQPAAMFGATARYDCTHRQTWFGAGDYKWHALAAEADRRPETRGLASRCTSAYERGLLEWRRWLAPCTR